jgi:hypothetical protein
MRKKQEKKFLAEDPEARSSLQALNMIFPLIDMLKHYSE